MARGTRVEPAELGETITAGQYQPSRNTVIINVSRLTETSVLAAALAHEVYHAAADAVGPLRKLSPRWTAYCLEEEMEAYVWTASTWQKVRLGTERSHEAQMFNRLTDDYWRTKRLRELVLSLPGHIEDCLVRPLPGY